MDHSANSVVSLIQGGEDLSATAWEAPPIDSGGGSVGVKQGEKERRTSQQLEEGYRKGLESGRAEGRRKGYQEGYQEGMAAATAEGRQQHDAVLGELRTLVDSLKTPLGSQLDEEIARSIASLVIQISSQVVKSELSLRPEHITDVVNDLFHHMPMTEREVRLYLHPEDRILVEEGMGRSSGGIQWRIEEDENLVRGGCHVESRNFSVEATLEHRLKQAIDQVFGHLNLQGEEG